MGEIADAIMKEIDTEVKNRIQQAFNQGLSNARMNIYSFYTGSPVMYERTYTYGNDTLKFTNVSGSKGNYKYSIYLQPQSYNTGHHDAMTILQSIQSGAYGVVGTPGTWNKAKKSIIEAVKSSFSG